MAALPLVHAGFGTPEKQNRWSVAFRLILIIPQGLALIVLGIAAVVLVIIGWFCALILGRLPTSFAQYLSSVTVYSTRVASYGWLMHGKYPPFSFSGDYPVNLDIPVTRVRRVAVLFRIILLIPVGIVSSVVSGGAAVAAIFIWLIVLVNGRMPLSLFASLSAMLRFQARYNAYAVMLTGKYPGELFGDQPVSVYGPPPGTAAYPPPAPPYPSAAPPAYPPPTVAPAMPPPAPPYPGPAAPGGVSTAPPSGPSAGADPGGGSAGYWQPRATPEIPPLPVPVPPAAGFPPPPPAAPPKTGRIVLSRGSKRILVVFIVLGVIANIGNITLQSTLRNAGARAQLISDHNALAHDIDSAISQRSACSADPATCVNQYWDQLATAYRTFQASVAGIAFPASAQSDVSHLDSDIGSIIDELTGLVAQGSTSQEDIARVQSLVDAAESDFTTLADDLT